MLLQDIKIGKVYHYTYHMKDILKSRQHIERVKVLEVVKRADLTEDDLIKVRCVDTGEEFKCMVDAIQPDPRLMKELYEEYIELYEQRNQEPMLIDAISRKEYGFYYGRRGNMVHYINKDGMFRTVHVMWIPALKDTEDKELSERIRRKQEMEHPFRELSFGSSLVMIPKVKHISYSGGIIV